MWVSVFIGERYFLFSTSTLHHLCERQTFKEALRTGKQHSHALSRTCMQTVHMTLLKQFNHGSSWRQYSLTEPLLCVLPEDESAAHVSVHAPCDTWHSK